MLHSMCTYSVIFTIGGFTFSHVFEDHASALEFFGECVGALSVLVYLKICSKDGKYGVTELMYDPVCEEE